MARIKLDLPADFPFTAELRVRITDCDVHDLYAERIG